MRSKLWFVAALLTAVPACSDDSQGPEYVPPDSVPYAIPPEVSAWLQSAARPFATPESGSGFEDLQFLKGMIGDARVVSLGEATHGTREFFQMKHRVLEFLVKEMDFNVFGIEATWPEANLVNDFVQTGQGDPAVLLSGLYFWTWNTQEVMDMILWMREHNEDPGDDPKVSFLGFDMQYPGLGIQNVVEYLVLVDPEAAAEASTRYACMSAFANGPRGFTGLDSRYRNQTQSYRDTCVVALQAVLDSLIAHQNDYEAASSDGAYALAEQSARVVLQYEDMESGRTMGARDYYMAENAKWLLEQAGPDSKMVLWAHNGHIADDPNYGQSVSMGYYLRRHYADDLVIAGFDFYQGGFRAVTYIRYNVYGGVENHTVGPPLPHSYEDYFHSAGMDRFVLDLRGVGLGSSATTWLAGPRLMRSIGSVFSPTNPDSYFREVSIPSYYDLIIYFDSTTAAVGLPFQYPDSW
jgi:erythromycin esterase